MKKKDKKEKVSKSFRETNKKEEALISSSARINMNNSSTGFLMNGAQNLLNNNFSNSFLSDLKKTFNLNIDILKQYIKSNNNPLNINNEIISLLNSII